MDDAALESVGGDAALLSEIIDIFLADCPRWLRDLEAAIGEDRGDEARRLAHSLKNSAGYFCASAIRQAVQLPPDAGLHANRINLPVKCS